LWALEEVCGRLSGGGTLLKQVVLAWAFLWALEWAWALGWASKTFFNSRALEWAWNNFFFDQS